MMSKQDYLKKYLSGGGKDKKKRRKVEKKKKTVVVLDDDADWKKTVQSSDDSESDTPIIVGEVIQEHCVHAHCDSILYAHVHVSMIICTVCLFTPRHFFKVTC